MSEVIGVINYMSGCGDCEPLSTPELSGEVVGVEQFGDSVVGTLNMTCGRAERFIIAASDRADDPSLIPKINMRITSCGGQLLGVCGAGICGPLARPRQSQG